MDKFFKSAALHNLPDGSVRAERTVAKTVRVFRMMMAWANETGRIDDIDLDAKHLRVRAKGNVVQVKFIKTDLRRLLRRYLAEKSWHR